jgi:general secretion pathway protein B
MSYILDALKKSEAERSRGTVPTLLTPPQTSFRSNALAWVLLGALIVNAGLFAAWMFWPTKTPVATGTSPISAQVAAPSQIVSNGDVEPQTAAAPAARAPTIPAQPTAAPARSVRPPLETDFKRISPPSESDDEPSVPVFSFSTHVYGSDPSMRAVTMDGKRYVEGDMLSPGVTIKEITETGVVLDVNGRSVPMDVLQDWR